MKETQQSISQWAEDTFGTAGSLFRIATRANEEMAELLVAVELNPEKAPEEAADVAIILCRVAERLNFNLFVEVALDPECTPTQYAADASVVLNLTLRGIAWGAINSDSDRNNVIRNIRSAVSSLRLMCQKLDAGLDFEIDKKMATNRSRTWDLDGSGHGYHCGG